jgi:hypothetical protein
LFTIWLCISVKVLFLISPVPVKTTCTCTAECPESQYCNNKVNVKHPSFYAISIKVFKIYKQVNHSAWEHNMQLILNNKFGQQYYASPDWWKESTLSWIVNKFMCMRVDISRKEMKTTVQSNEIRLFIYIMIHVSVWTTRIATT